MARPTKTTQRSYRLPTAVLVVAGVWAANAGAVAINLATTKRGEHPALPALLRPIGTHPWAAVAAMTVVASVAAGWLWRREAAGRQPPAGGALVARLAVDRHRTVTRRERAVVRKELLDQVRSIWIQGVLDRSLAEVVRVELGLLEQPEVVLQPWKTLPGQPAQPLPPGTPIGELAARFKQRLLLLGAPGAGKTTLLLEYTRQLLDEAEVDPLAPVPVVFHLSAWPAHQPPLAVWLVDELALRYSVSRRFAVDLVEGDRLAVLLDGLDEVAEGARAACVAAINAFRSDHGGVPMVVCARTLEYQQLTAQLRLNGAVQVQPLDRAQVRGWLRLAGGPLAGLRQALDDPAHPLWALLDSPLLLWIATLAYNGQPAAMIRPAGGVQHLLGVYVEEMLTRPRAPLEPAGEQPGYGKEEIMRWLGWLARRLGNQSLFYPDWMQPDWLPARRQQWLATTGFGLAAGLAAGLLVGLLYGLAAGLDEGLTTGLTAGLTAGLAAGLGTLLGTGVTRRDSRIEPIEPAGWSWHSARRGLAAGLAAGLGGGLLFGLLFGPRAGLTAGLGTVVAMVLAEGFASRANLQPAAPLEGIRAAARVWLRGGLTAVLSITLVCGLTVGLLFGLLVGLVVGLTTGLIIGLPTGLHRGGASYLRHRLLVALLRRQGLIPADLIGFLDYADSRILLRRAGGGYLFIHRLLQDHLARQAR